MVAINAFLAITLPGLAIAWPEPTPAANLDNRAIDCSKVTGALSILKKAGPPATSFCSSFLKIPGTQTATTTFTPAAVTIATSTTTVSVTSAVCDKLRRDVPIEYRDIKDTRATNAEVIGKRTDGLALLAAFAAAKVSEGCRCLNLQPKATKTTTQTAPALTIKVVATSTACVVAPPQCTPAGGPCDLARPDLCCNFICFNSNPTPYCG